MSDKKGPMSFIDYGFLKHINNKKSSWFFKFEGIPKKGIALFSMCLVSLIYDQKALLKTHACHRISNNSIQRYTLGRCFSDRRTNACGWLSYFVSFNFFVYSLFMEIKKNAFIIILQSSEALHRFTGWDVLLYNYRCHQPV